MSIFLRTMIMMIGLSISLPFLSYGETPFCYKELERNFFKPALVDEALSLHSVPQSNWSLINNELQRNVKRVPELVKERAKRMDPNPFGTPFQPQAASEVLRGALLEVFSSTLALFHITNQNNINEMFQYIRERQSQFLLACFGDEEIIQEQK